LLLRYLKSLSYNSVAELRKNTEKRYKNMQNLMSMI